MTCCGFAIGPRPCRMTSPTERLAIRPATAADVAALGRLGALLVHMHHELDPARFLAATPRTEEGYGRFLGSQLGEQGVVVLVAPRDGLVVGYTYATVEGHDWMALRGPAGVVHDLVVDPAHRGSGVGRLLLETTISALRERGVPRVVLSAAARNDAAQRLFARMGFRSTLVEMTRDLEAGAS